MTTARPLTILLTGASSGIGRVSALHLARKGYRVLATVRKDKDAESLRAENVPSLEPSSWTSISPTTSSASDSGWTPSPTASTR